MSQRKSKLLKEKLEKEAKNKAPLAKNVRELMQNLPDFKQRDLAEKVVADLGATFLNAYDVMSQLHQKDLEIASFDETAIHKDKVFEAYKKEVEARLKVSEDSLAAAREEIKKKDQEIAGLKAHASKVIDLQGKLEAANKASKSACDARDLAESAKAALEKDFELQKKTLKETADALKSAKDKLDEVQEQHRRRLQDEQVLFQDRMREETDRLKKAHQEELDAQEDRICQEMSDSMWGTLERYLPAFQKDFPFSAFKTFVEDQLQAERDQMAAFDVAASGGGPADLAQ